MMQNLRKLSDRENELYQRVDEVLHYLWDPIGVSDVPGARDEYHSYVPQVFSLLKQRKENAKKDMNIAEILINWREELLDD